MRIRLTGLEQGGIDLDVPEEELVNVVLLKYKENYFQFDFRPAMSFQIPVFKLIDVPLDVNHYGD